MKERTTITLRGSNKLLRVGSIRSPAALPRMAVRGRAFLSEHADDKRFRYYKDGLSPRETHHTSSPLYDGYRFAPPILLASEFQLFRPACQPTAASGTESVEAK